jgi:hypothetical protein
VPVSGHFGLTTRRAATRRATQRWENGAAAGTGGGPVPSHGRLPLFQSRETIARTRARSIGKG